MEKLVENQNRVKVHWRKATNGSGTAGFPSMASAMAWVGLYEVDYAFAEDTQTGEVYEFTGGGKE